MNFSSQLFTSASIPKITTYTFHCINTRISSSFRNWKKRSMNRQMCLRKFSHEIILNSNKFLTNEKESSKERKICEKGDEYRAQSKNLLKVNWHEPNRFLKRNNSERSHEKTYYPPSTILKSNFQSQAMLFLCISTLFTCMFMGKTD